MMSENHGGENAAQPMAPRKDGPPHRPPRLRDDPAVLGPLVFCVAWAAACPLGLRLGLLPRAVTPDLSPSTWPLLAACPLVFWLGYRESAAGRRRRRPRILLSILALGLGVVFFARDAESGVAGIHPNDLASLLALLLPWWLLVGLGPASRGLRRLPGLAAAGACGVALVATGSRGGLAAALVGSLLGALVAGSFGGFLRPRRRAVGLLLALGLAGAVASEAWPSLAETRLHQDIRSWARGHDAEGFTWSHLASGRPLIWRQATRAVADLPLFGAGPGAYGRLVPDVYPPPVRRIDLHQAGKPQAPRVDDAHQLYLESALAFGVPFLLGFLGLCAVGLLRRIRAGDGAVFGGLSAYLLHGLVDCAAPGPSAAGTLVYAAGWAALGCACAPTVASAAFDSSESAAMPGGSRVHRLLAGGLAPALLVAALAGPLLGLLLAHGETLHRHLIATVADGTRAEAGAALEALEGRGEDSCRHAWWRERLAVAAGRDAGRDATGHAVAVARCRPERIADVAALSPLDVRRAAAVFEARPHHPDALRWRLWTLEGGPPGSQPSATGLDFVRGSLEYFARRPHDADAKMEFLRRMPRAWLDEHAAFELALLAHACAHGDPGANACLGAGTLAERLGLGADVADAFYLASEWPGARRRARAGRP